MSFFRSPGNSTVQTPQYTGVQMQASSSALPIPILWGMTLVAPNVVWAGDFLASPQYSQPSGKGGVFGGAGSSQPTGYEYFSALVFGLCEGPISTVRWGYDGQDTYSLYQLNCGIIKGATPQTPWSYLSANHPKRALAYPGTALVVSSSFDLGSSASVGSLSFEVVGAFSGTSVTTTDADPAQIVFDFLTNAQYGVGFPAGSIDATALYGLTGASYQAYCAAIGIGLSPALTDQESANSILARWLQLTNSTAVWSGGRLKIIPFGDAPVTGTLNGGGSTQLPAQRDAGLRSYRRRLHRRHRRRPGHRHALRSLFDAQRRQSRGAEPRTDGRLRADRVATELLRADADPGARPERDRELRPAHRPDRHGARDLHRRDRPDRGAAHPPARALCPQHLCVQALVGMLPARADGHRHAERCQSRSREDAGAHSRDRRGRRWAADGHGGGISRGDRVDARLRGRCLDLRGDRLAQRRAGAGQHADHLRAAVRSHRRHRANPHRHLGRYERRRRSQLGRCGDLRFDRQHHLPDDRCGLGALAHGRACNRARCAARLGIRHAASELR